MKKVISISTDRNIFKDNSPVRLRMAEHAGRFDELHIIVFSNFFKHSFARQKKVQIAPNAWVYSTRSWSKWFYMRNAFNLAKKIIGDLSFDLPAQAGIGNSDNNVVITCQDPFEVGRVGVRIKELFKIPLQIQVHTDFLSPHFAHKFLNRVRVKMARNILAKADRIRVVSKRIADSLIEGFKIPKDKVFVLPVFVDIQKIINTPVQTDLHKKYPQFNFITLMASRLTEEKNIDLAIKAFARVLKSFPRAGLIIVGSGSEFQNLKNVVNGLGISKSVIFEGWQNDLISYYKTANLYLLTSLYEGFSMTLVESAVSGCPIVTSDVGIAGDIFLNNEHVVVCEVHNETCFAQNILSMIGSNNKREVLRQSAKARAVEMFFINKEDYLKKYAELLNI